MSPCSLTPSLARQDRNSHEVSAEEARPCETRREQNRGGGHRSGSRGAGTLEDTGSKPAPRLEPQLPTERDHAWA